VFRNILVGIDGTAGSEEALRQAIDLANATRGRLGLLSVAPRVCAWYASAPFGPPFPREQLDADLVAEAKRHLEAAAEQVPSDVPVTKLFARGRPADALVTQALGGCWDLIVVGHRPGWRAHARLVRSSPVPVLIVGGTGTRSAVAARGLGDSVLGIQHEPSRRRVQSPHVARPRRHGPRLR
jgi:nucleotide-binding universal stress UspA family protein